MTKDDLALDSIKMGWSSSPPFSRALGLLAGFQVPHLTEQMI